MSTPSSMDEPFLMLTPEERAERVADLEQHFGMTSAEAVSRAIAGSEPISPLFAEWMILMDRGDLARYNGGRGRRARGAGG